MYKSIKITNNRRLSINTFRLAAKEVSIVYKTGIRNWTSDDSRNYSIVIGTFRLIYSIHRPQFGTITPETK